MSLSKFRLFSALYLFASTSNLVKYFRGRYNDQLVRNVNRGLRLRSKCVRSKENVRFLKKCLEQHVAPSAIRSRVKKGRPKNFREIEVAVIRDEIVKCKELLEDFNAEYHRVLTEIWRGLSFMDRIRFGKLLNETAARLLYRIKTKKDRTLKWLIKTQLGCGTVDHAVITNLSSVELSDVEKNVLCRGLNFGVLPRLCKEEIKAEFELCWDQLKDVPSTSTERCQECKSSSSSMAYKYAIGFTWQP